MSPLAPFHGLKGKIKRRIPFNRLGIFKCKPAIIAQRNLDLLLGGERI